MTTQPLGKFYSAVLDEKVGNGAVNTKLNHWEFGNGLGPAILSAAAEHVKHNSSFIATLIDKSCLYFATNKSLLLVTASLDEWVLMEEDTKLSMLILCIVRATTESRYEAVKRFSTFHYISNMSWFANYENLAARWNAALFNPALFWKAAVDVVAAVAKPK